MKYNKNWTGKPFLFPHGKGIVQSTQIDFHGDPFLVFEQGVPIVELKRYGFEFCKFKQLGAIVKSLIHLNPRMDMDWVFYWIDYLREVHFINWFAESSVERMTLRAKEDWQKGTLVPFSTKRKLLFNPEVNLSKSEKMKITQEVFGRKVYTEEDIYNGIESMMQKNMNPTYDNIANEITCSVRTVKTIINDSPALYDFLMNEKQEYSLNFAITKVVNEIQKAKLRGESISTTELKRRAKVSGSTWKKIEPIVEFTPGTQKCK